MSFIEDQNNDLAAFSKDNRLFNYKADKFNELCIMSPNADDLLYALANGTKFDISLKTILKNERLAKAGQMKNIEASSDILSFINITGSAIEAFDYLLLNSVKIQKTYNNPGMFVFYGCFEHSTSDNKIIKTPLFLYPVEIKQKDEDSFVLVGQSDCIFVNPVARLYFYEENNVVLPVSFPLCADGSFVNAVNRIKGIVKSSSLSKKVMLDFNVLNLTVFPVFTSYMYADHIINYTAASDENVDINSVLDRFNCLKNNDNQNHDDIPNNLNEVTFAPPDVLRTMAAVKRGESFVIENYSGCDKDAAIVNLIAEAVSDNHSVLYVSRYDRTIIELKEKLDRLSLMGLILMPCGKFNETFVSLACRFLKSAYDSNKINVSVPSFEVSKTADNIKKTLEEYKQLIYSLQRKDNFLNLPFEYIFEEYLKLSELPLVPLDFLDKNKLNEKDVRFIYNTLDKYDKVRLNVNKDITLINNPWLNENKKQRFTKEDIKNIVLCLNGINDELKYFLKQTDSLKKYGLKIASSREARQALKTVEFLLENSANRRVLKETCYFSNNEMLSKVLNAIYSENESEEEFCTKLTQIKKHLLCFNTVNSEKRIEFLSRFIPDVGGALQGDFTVCKTYMKKLYEGITAIGESELTTLSEIEDELSKLGLLRFAVKVHNEHLIKSSSDVFKKGILHKIISRITYHDSIKNVTSAKFDLLYNSLDNLLSIFHRENVEHINAVYKNKQKEMLSSISTSDKNMLVSCIKHKTEAFSLDDSNINRLMQTFISSFPFTIMNIKDTVRFLPKESKFDILIIDDAETLSLPDVLSVLERCKRVVIIGQKEHGFNLYRTHRVIECSDVSALSVNSLFDISRQKLEVYKHGYITEADNAYIEKIKEDLYNDDSFVCLTREKSFEDKNKIIRFENLTGASFDIQSGVNSSEAERIADIVKSIVIKRPNSSISVLCSYSAQCGEIINKLNAKVISSPRFKAFLTSSRANEQLFISSYKEAPPFKTDYVIFSSSITNFKKYDSPIDDDILVPTILSKASKGLIIVSSFSKEECLGEYKTIGKKMFAKLVTNISSYSYATIKNQAVFPPSTTFLLNRGYKAFYNFNKNGGYINLTVTSNDMSKILCVSDFDFKYNPTYEEIYKNEYVKRHIIEQSGISYIRQFSSQWYTDHLSASASVANAVLKGSKNSSNTNEKTVIPYSNIMKPNYYYSITPQKQGISPEDECIEVIKNEAPINEQWLFSRYVVKWYSSLRNKDAVKAFNAMLSKIVKENPFISRYKGFIYNSSSEIRFRCAYTKQDERLVENISNEEIEALIGDVFIDRIIKNVSITPKTVLQDLVVYFPNAEQKDIKRLLKLSASFIKEHKKYIP